MVQGISRRAQRDLHCEILRSVLEYFEGRLDDYLHSEQQNASEDLIHLLDSA